LQSQGKILKEEERIREAFQANFKDVFRARADIDGRGPFQTIRVGLASD